MGSKQPSDYSLIHVYKRFQQLQESHDGYRTSEGKEKEGCEERQEEEGNLRYLHLQGVEASSSRYWRLFQGHEHHELLRERSVRAHCCRSEQAGQLQQAVHHHLPRDSDRRPA